MFKKYFMALIFFCIYSNLTYAENDFKLEKYDEMVLDDLSLKEIMRNFYYERLSYMSGKMYEEIEDENESAMSRYEKGYAPKLKEIENSILITMPDEYNEKLGIPTYSQEGYFGAELSPIQDYHNAQGDKRYLIGVMISGLNENHTAQYSTPAMSKTDFYTFKKTQGEKYQLVSRSKEDKEPTTSSCRNDASFLYPANKIKIQKIGNDIVGAVFDYCFIAQNIYQKNWMILQLLEDDYIDVKYVDKAGSNMLEEENPLYYDYDSDLKVIENNQKYYPLLIHYKGEMPISEKNSSKSSIKKVDYMSKWVFDENKKEYIEESKTK